MQPLISTVRAIGVEFVRRTTKPLIIIGTIATVVLLALGGWLASGNAWWWILEAVLIVYSLLFVAVVVGLRLVLRAAEPALDREQRAQVVAFVDKLERTSEHLQTPQPLIIFRVVKDIVRHKGDDSFIATVSRDTRSLAPDFVELQQSFRQH